jgi:hypothetical protein
MCKNYLMLGTVTGVFIYVSQICTAMLHQCMVGGSNGMTNVKHYQHFHNCLSCGLSESVCGPHDSPAVTMLIHVCYIFKTTLSTSTFTNLKFSRCASFMWQNSWKCKVSENRFHFRQYKITKKTHTRCEKMNRIDAWWGTSKKILGSTYTANECVNVITTKNKIAAFESI